MTNVPKRSLLTFIKDCPKAKSGHKKALYKCECGNVKEFYVCNVNSMHTTCCGCVRDTSGYKRHGLIKHPLYSAHSNMVQRCTNPNNSFYHLYGGAGVTVCSEWVNDFKAFYDWCMANGWEPGLEVDKDTRGGNVYSPGNCIIISHKSNSNKRSNNHYIEYNGVVKTIQEWSDEFGIDSGSLRYRLRVNDWDIEKARAMVLRKQKSKIKKTPKDEQ